MIRAYAVDADRLRPVVSLDDDNDRIVWIDLLNPTPEEEKTIERWIGTGIPTRDEMEEIEVSSRLYTEGEASFMTATVPAHVGTDDYVMGPVTFVLVRDRLVTVRYHEPRAFRTFAAHAERADLGCAGGRVILVSLLEAVVDRLADLLERANRDVLEISHEVFHPTEKKASKRDLNFQMILRRIGRKEQFISHIQDSLMSLQRLSGFLSHVNGPGRDQDVRARVKTLGRDIVSLADYAESLAQKVVFLLDATLGMINIEQNAIIKIVSVAAVVFLPPTLIASVYGMNFASMPELGWRWGYPLAILLMVVAAVLPAWWFKRRGWL